MKKILFFIIVFAGIIASCSSDSSEDVLSMGEMEDILYDIHLSQNMSVGGDSKSKTLDEIKNREAIFKKYDITTAEWDSSFTYYCRHADKLHHIYENLTERVRDEVVDLGGDVNIDDATMSGDTTNIWNSDHNFILMMQAPYNLKTYSLQSDSTFKAGDMVTLQFDAKFIFQEGNREMACVMAVTLGNDSIVSIVRHINGDGINNVTYRDMQHYGIKSVRGYFMISRNINDQVTTTFHLVSVENVKMLLAHEKENAADGEQNVGSQDANPNMQNMNASKDYGPAPDTTKHNLSPKAPSNIHPMMESRDASHMQHP